MYITNWRGSNAVCRRGRRLPLNSTMKKLPNSHPADALQEEFLVPMGISAYRLAKDIGIPQTRVSQILKGERRLTANSALRLSKYFERRRAEFAVSRRSPLRICDTRVCGMPMSFASL